MKLRSNELRMGNWVNCIGGQCLVRGVTKGGIWINDVGGPISDMDTFAVRPIFLTEEWLLKFGFVSNPYEDRYEKGLLHIECNKTRGVLEFWIEKLPVSLTLKFVHQLQNLYFALTGEELTIKE